MLLKLAERAFDSQRDESNSRFAQRLNRPDSHKNTHAFLASLRTACPTTICRSSWSSAESFGGGRTTTSALTFSVADVLGMAVALDGPGSGALPSAFKEYPC